MSTSEIIAELPRLSERELAQVQTKLLELTELANTRNPLLRIQSPRLADPSVSKELAKQVLEFLPDAKL